MVSKQKEDSPQVDVVVLHGAAVGNLDQLVLKHSLNVLTRDLCHTSNLKEQQESKLLGMSIQVIASKQLQGRKEDKAQGDGLSQTVKSLPIGKIS